MIRYLPHLILVVFYAGCAYAVGVIVAAVFR